MTDVLLTYSELTRIFPVAEGTLRCWVSEDRIQPRAKRGRTKMFSCLDVQRAYDRRHANDDRQAAAA